MKVLAHIREQYSLSLGSYGRPRMTMELKEAGLEVGERRVGRLMRINGIKPVRTRKHKVTTDSHHRLGVAANWLDGDFSADAPNRKWAGDITSIWTFEDWLYLAVILDLHSRRIVGWAVSDRMKKDLAIRAPGAYGGAYAYSTAELHFRLRSQQLIFALMTLRRSCEPMACIHQ